MKVHTLIVKLMSLDPFREVAVVVPPRKFEGEEMRFLLPTGDVQDDGAVAKIQCTTLWGMGDASDVPAPRPGHETAHPRNDFVVAVFVGQSPGESAPGTLVEIHEQYNVWGQASSKSHHYRPYNLRTGRQGEIKTIGAIRFDPESDQPPFFVQNCFKGYSWRRLR